MKITSVVGVNFGDEGKGRMVDYFAGQYDYVVRYQGGDNAGHTVKNEFGEFALHLIPSGIFHEKTVNILGPGMVVNLESLKREIDQLKEGGIHVGPDNLKVSHRASLLLPYHVQQDQEEEKRLKDKKYGSTKRGIAPAYGDKYMKKTIQLGELYDMDLCKDHFDQLVEYKKEVFNYQYDFTGIWDRLVELREELLPYIVDVYDILDQAVKDKSILLEAQLGAMRDVDYGIYPYTSSSSPLACYAPLGCGYPKLKIDSVVGIVKAYGTCVGEGPFVGELTGDQGDRLRELGHEYGAATGRPRRISYFDCVSSRYGVNLQGATELALTKLDVLSSYDEIPMIVAYKKGDITTKEFPFTPMLDGFEPVYKTFKGWKQDLTGIKTYQDLPQEAKDYIEAIEEELATPIKYISIGPARDELIVR